MRTTGVDVKTSKHAIRYVLVGIGATLFNYILFVVLANLLIRDNSLLWLSSLIATAATTIVAFIAHSRITWKDRSVTKAAIARFFIWNAILTAVISPSLTQFFSVFTLLYEFAFNVASAMRLPFTYDFILTTGTFVLTSAVIMVLNFLFYDKFVFKSSVVDKGYTYVPELEAHKVSVIVPIYNTEKYLGKCLDSIIKQTHRNLEIILVDDGSTDGSGKIVDQYAKKDERVRVIHQKNQGQSAARNAGLKVATGKYVSFIDSDDVVKASFVASLLAPYAEPDTVLTVCGIRYKRLKKKTAENVYIKPLSARGKKESLKGYILRLLAIDGRMYSSVNKLYLARIAKKVRFDVGLDFAEDTKFVLDYLERAEGEIRFVLKPLYVYNFGTEGSTIKRTATRWENWQNSYRILKKWLGAQRGWRERFWLYMVHCRWRISYIRSRRRAR